MNRNLVLFFPLNFNRIMAIENGKIINEKKKKLLSEKNFPCFQVLVQETVFWGGGGGAGGKFSNF
jgi:hypothetical protein